MGNILSNSKASNELDMSIRVDQLILLTGVYNTNIEIYHFHELKESVDLHDKISTQIKRDTSRTFGRDHESIQSPTFPNKLFNILRVFAETNPGIGYCQGMNFVASAILFLVREDEVKGYLFFSGLMNRYGMIFDKNQQIFRLLTEIISSFLQRKESTLFLHLQENGLEISFIVSRWFHCLYAHEYFPIEMTISIWGAILQPDEKGLIKFIEVAIYFLKKTKSKILNISENYLILEFLQTPNSWSIHLPDDINWWNTKSLEFSSDEVSKILQIMEIITRNKSKINNLYSTA